MQSNIHAAQPQTGLDLEFWRTVVDRTGHSKSEIYRRMKLGQFPQCYNYPDKQGVFWLSSEVHSWQLNILAEVGALGALLG
jgi:predicted DNA-binding transcriptional regulator AlpA